VFIGGLHHTLQFTQRLEAGHYPGQADENSQGYGKHSDSGNAIHRMLLFSALLR
jgi:hypothetical protein